MTRRLPANARPAGRLLGSALLLAAMLPAAGLAQNRSGPMVCTTTIEAPPVTAGAMPLAPVEVTRCSPAMSVTDVVNRHYYAYSAPFARGIDITHQLTDFLGIAMGGGDGTRMMGFGFPDQAIVWDGSAINNLYDRMLDAQSAPLPLRTPDLANPYRTSLGMSMYSAPPQDPLSATPVTAPTSDWSQQPVRGLW
ncbi:MAG: Occludin/ELL family protein [Synechococcaceae cyanobacterium]|nr:Occludin/ELL family protein [Synechococcaceae cyanobacterium]